MAPDQPTPPAPLSQALPVLSREVRKAAKHIRNLGYGGKWTPEQILQQKQEIAAHLEALAGAVDAALAKADTIGGAN